ncbi:hypothetical protein [Kribbella sp. NPDC048915]|uniref:hypothetical protein n=1 Tax=Kribbella sp. NPDC048915 TaxID=3155148 RepID=UPI0033DFE3AA
MIAFAPRKDGEIFSQTATRLGRTRGVALEELDHLPTVRPAVRPARKPAARSAHRACHSPRT